MLLQTSEASLGEIVEAHCIPANMFEAVEQYRLDLVEDELQRNGRGIARLAELLGSRKFGDPFMLQFSPYLHAVDSEWFDLPISGSVQLLPLPSVVADRSLFPAGELWHELAIPQPVSTASDDDVLFFARMVALSMLDISWSPQNRREALVYISRSNFEHPARKEYTRYAEQLRPFSRTVVIPDMVEKRRRDIAEVFRLSGVRPLERFELECLSPEDVAIAAEHVRFYCLDNLHPTFCNICQRKVEQLIEQHLRLDAGEGVFRN